MNPPSESPTGVIHDIGYRGYEGPRLGRRAVARALFVHSLRGVFGLGRSGRSKVLPIGMFVLMCLPAVVLATVTVVGAGQGVVTQPPLAYSSYAMVMQAAIAIFLATQAPQAVSLDLRFNTVPLYFSRPLERIDYVTAKYAALAAGVFILLAVPIIVMYAGALLAEFSFGGETSDVAVALGGAVLYSLVLSGLCLLIASTTSRRGFGVAAIITVLALSYTVVTVLQGIVGHGQNDMATAGWLGLFSPMTLVDGVQAWALGADPSTIAGPPNDVAGIVFCLVALAVIAGCFRLLVFRYRKVKL
ncbi:ABC transporter permease [Phytoactinopolyspora mesophila]|uniref:ABC transporter permease n=1 Tax=Phytoactinopolyspora mesophila TaxID=2650750 RepID=A0A7K3M7I6_9ACTN|nr:ABC transporter permease [Phytoactinopolyspora mesophila]NDL58368.1 ABC transporter permease [Phytoactinopolyspora mesophila]